MTEPNSLIAAFALVRDAEDALAEAKADAQRAIQKANQAEHALALAWDAVASLMAATGEYEAVLPGIDTDYLIAWSKPRESVKVIDPEAVPDEFCKLERKPRLKEIGDMLKECRDNGITLPNWAALEPGQPKLGWKPVKKSTSAKE